MANDITSVVEEGLCTGCGTCEGLCREGAIKTEIDPRKGFYTPRVDEDKCTRCGVCFQVCPGHAVDFEDLAPPVSAESKQDHDGGYSKTDSHATKETVCWQKFLMSMFQHRS